MTARPQPITVTTAAAERVKALIGGRAKPSAGVRIGIRTKGCSGMSYTLEFADEKGPMDEVVEQTGFELAVDHHAKRPATTSIECRFAQLLCGHLA